MLDRAGDQRGALDGLRLAVEVPAGGDDVLEAAAVEAQPGDGQAALGTELLGLVGGVPRRVDHVALDPVGTEDEHPQPDADLRGRQPGAALLAHRLVQVRDEGAQLAVEVDDGLGLRAQDGVAEQAQRLGGHRSSLGRLRAQSMYDVSGCRRPPGGVPADEAEHAGLGVGVVSHRHPRPVLARRPDRVLHLLHAPEERCAERGVETVVLAGGPREVPGVHEDVGRVDHVRRAGDRHGAEVRVVDLLRRRSPGRRAAPAPPRSGPPRPPPGRPRRPARAAASRRPPPGTPGTTTSGGPRRPGPSSPRPGRARPSRPRPVPAR